MHHLFDLGGGLHTLSLHVGASIGVWLHQLDALIHGQDALIHTKDALIHGADALIHLG